MASGLPLISASLNKLHSSDSWSHSIPLNCQSCGLVGVGRANTLFSLDTSRLHVHFRDFKVKFRDMSCDL